MFMHKRGYKQKWRGELGVPKSFRYRVIPRYDYYIAYVTSFCDVATAYLIKTVDFYRNKNFDTSIIAMSHSPINAFLQIMLHKLQAKYRPFKVFNTSANYFEAKRSKKTQ